MKTSDLTKPKDVSLSDYSIFPTVQDQNILTREETLVIIQQIEDYIDMRTISFKKEIEDITEYLQRLRKSVDT